MFLCQNAPVVVLVESVNVNRAAAVDVITQKVAQNGRKQNHSPPNMSAEW